MRPRSGQASSLETATSWYAKALDGATLDYLAGRGIDESVAATYRLGLVSDPILGHEMFRDRLAVPYLTQAGVRTIKFRCLDDHDCKAERCPKYLGVPGARPYMYNPSALLAAEAVAICEGELDAIVCSGVVGLPAVGVAGVSTWQDHFPRMFAGIPNVLVIRDHDVKGEGRDPGKELAERIAKSVDQSIVITPPAGMDLSEWVVAEGVDSVREVLGL